MSLIPQHPITLTDLYQLTMAAGYFQHDLNHSASFELYVRKLPPQRSYLVAAGLDQALDYLQNLHFQPEEIEFLKNLPAFKQVDPQFFEYLKDFRFHGDIFALPEGTVFFPYEPLVRVCAPLIEAQIVETYLLSLLNYQTGVASKAARISQVLPAQITFMDFGSRRAHGPEAGLLAARAAYIGGAMGTSNVYAAMQLGIPVMGTAAHAWTMAFESESEAFAAYKAVFPKTCTLLIDTYDTLEGARNAIATGRDIAGVRLDSGDFLVLSREVRALLDAADMPQAKIVVSGDMNEYKIQELLRQGAPIDTFGVGTELVTCKDAPSLGGVYKLVEQIRGGETRYMIKLSESKISYPGAKQVYRFYEKGQFSYDLLTLADEAPPEGGRPLLQKVMQGGQRLGESTPLPAIQALVKQQLAELTPELKALDWVQSYPVKQSSRLLALYESLKNQQAERLNKGVVS